MKKTLEMSSFYICVPKIIKITKNLSPKNQNFVKMKKTPGDIILHMLQQTMIR